MKIEITSSLIEQLANYKGWEFSILSLPNDKPAIILQNDQQKILLLRNEAGDWRVEPCNGSTMSLSFLTISDNLLEELQSFIAYKMSFKTPSLTINREVDEIIKREITIPKVALRFELPEEIRADETHPLYKQEDSYLLSFDGKDFQRNDHMGFGLRIPSKNFGNAKPIIVDDACLDTVTLLNYYDIETLCSCEGTDAANVVIRSNNAFCLSMIFSQLEAAGMTIEIRNYAANPQPPFSVENNVETLHRDLMAETYEFDFILYFDRKKMALYVNILLNAARDLGVQQIIKNEALMRSFAPTNSFFCSRKEAEFEFYRRPYEFENLVKDLISKAYTSGNICNLRIIAAIFASQDADRVLEFFLRIDFRLPGESILFNRDLYNACQAIANFAFQLQDFKNNRLKIKLAPNREESLLIKAMQEELKKLITYLNNYCKNGTEHFINSIFQTESDLVNYCSRGLNISLDSQQVLFAPDAADDANVAVTVQCGNQLKK